MLSSRKRFESNQNIHSNNIKINYKGEKYNDN